MTWKVVTATTAERLAQQLTALTAAGFTIHSILGGSNCPFTIVAWGETQEKPT